MPASIKERQALERERAELPGEIAAALTALAVTPLSHKARRERLMWQIQRDQRRMAEIEARLAAIEP
jgi:chromosome segregation ATPase